MENTGRNEETDQELEDEYNPPLPHPYRSYAPGPKATYGTLAGALTIILVWVAGLADIEVPVEVASAVTTIIAGLVVYFAPDNKNT